MGNASNANNLRLAWHGVHGDDRIWQADLATSVEGVISVDRWSRNTVVGTSADGPTLRSVGGRGEVYMALEGAVGRSESAIFLSSAVGRLWLALTGSSRRQATRP
jgi:hypothetical protein